MDGDIPLCPPWWPPFLWQGEWFPHKPGGGPGGPINYPPDVDDILVALTVNVLSYRLVDQDSAANIRALTVETITKTAGRLNSHPQITQ